jgi:UDP-glucose 4-epimerase
VSFVDQPVTAHRACTAAPGTWLLTGGAGYIGAHVARALRSAGHAVVLLDDLSTGSADRVADLRLIKASVLDSPKATAARMLEHHVTGIVHLAAKKSVPESLIRPHQYYEINVVGTLRLMEAAVLAGVTQLIYSSSAAVYGTTPERPITEDDGTDPASPYGESKLAAEWIVRRMADASGMTWTALRYFNVAGCAEGIRAEDDATNLIPRAISHVMDGKPVPVFGGDWPTADGSNVRDFLHVEDLADAHRAAVWHMERSGHGAGVLNVGRGCGVSVHNVLETVARLSGRSVQKVIKSRRPGDAAAVVADVSRIASRLEWSARHNLDSIVRSSIAAWVSSHSAAHPAYRERVAEHA